jgi:predicted RNA-binding Zn ribbon-like protein
MTDPAAHDGLPAKDIDDIDLIGGHPALDFVNSVEGRGSDSLLNYLADYDRLARWCVRVGLITPADGARVRRQAKRHAAIAARVWRAAMELREGLNDVFRALVRADDPPKPAVAILNTAIERASGNRRLQPTRPREIAWRWNQAKPGLEIVVWEIALAAAGLMTDPDRRARIRICANGPCDWMFLDTSRGRRRRWCRMGVCGNVSKVRRFRERQRGAS